MSRNVDRPAFANQRKLDQFERIKPGHWMACFAAAAPGLNGCELLRTIPLNKCKRPLFSFDSRA